MKVGCHLIAFFCVLLPPEGSGNEAFENIIIKGNAFFVRGVCVLNASCVFFLCLLILCLSLAIICKISCEIVHL